MRASHKRWYGAAAMALLVPTGGLVYRLVRSEDVGRLDAFHGLRLGMTPSQVRGSLNEGIPTTVDTDPSGLVRMGFDGTGDVRHAVLEFHAGLLVAVRADLTSDHPLSEGPRIESDADTLRHRIPDATGGVSLTLIARNCPAHREEVEALLSRP